MTRHLATTLVLAWTICSIPHVRGDDTFWVGAADSSFTNAANWSAGAPVGTEFRAVIEGGSNLPVTIPADAGEISVGAIQLGVEELGGELIQNGGTIVIDGDDIGEESVIGLLATEPTRWVLNNDAVVLYDGPLSGNGSGFDSDGTGKDFDVGKSTLEGAEGTLELHDNAAFHISDDLKVGDGDGGHGVVIMDGNSKFNIGSGISASGISRFDISGNATLVSGNSSAPGDMANGLTNEGYLTLSTDTAGEATINVRENGKVYVRTLQQRNGLSTIDLQDNAQFHVFEVFEHDAPNLGNATVEGAAQGPQRTSQIGSGGEMTIRLSGASQFSVDSDLEDSAWSGLAVSGGTNQGGNSEGGITTIEVSDEATFAIAQDLNLTLGTSEFAESTLRVIGPNAKVDINGDLRMALDEFEEANLGLATLEAVLTGSQHSTVNVGGTALIGNGALSVRFDGYTPIGGETYSLISAGSITDSGFNDTDLPALPDGLSWNLAVDANSVVLSIEGGGLLGDFDGNGSLDAEDIEALSAAVRAGSTEARFDVNADGLIDAQDRESWVNDVRRTYLGDANLDGEFNSGDLVATFTFGEYEDAVAGNSTWAEGDWDGNGDFDSGDFVAAFSAGGYEQGPRAAVASVPEPGSLRLCYVAALLLLCRRRA